MIDRQHSPDPDFTGGAIVWLAVFLFLALAIGAIGLAVAVFG